MKDKRPPAVVVINEAGFGPGAVVAGALEGALYVPLRLLPEEAASPRPGNLFGYEGSAGYAVRQLFRRGHGLVLVMAAGIAVRLLSGLPQDKRRDPPVVVLDTAGRYAVSLLAGHEGGANGLAYRVAAAVGAEPVVTTGSEVHRTLVVGLGCRRGVGAPAIMAAIEQGLALAGREKEQLRVAATADFKAEEPGILEVCAALGVGLRVFGRDAIRSVDRLFGESRCARKYFDVGGVAEPCAFLAARNGRIILPRLVAGQVTVALAEDRLWSPGSDRETPDT
ncbi:MAG: cobalamin biosynthesis protein [Thermoanaerobacterales bacterium]|nr:cobalamin biosynthesis protein [Bacillota bacterium]MDI6906964.1 cobalamin biosynthesis protein [Thermoanaerobacterales bacterium]